MVELTCEPKLPYINGNVVMNRNIGGKGGVPFSRRVARITDALTYLVTKAAERGDPIKVAPFNIKCTNERCYVSC